MHTTTSATPSALIQPTPHRGSRTQVMPCTSAGGPTTIAILLNAARMLSAAACLLAFCTAATPAVEIDIPEYNVQVEAVASPSGIVLTWNPYGYATQVEICRKELGSATWGAPIATLPGDALTYTDPSAVTGTPYEYQLTRRTSLTLHEMWQPFAQYGYVCGSIRRSVIDRRGTMILLVDQTMADPLAAELAQLRKDLIGDGWTVIPLEVSRTAAVTEVRALIKATCDATPGGVKSLFIFGHVPVPRSGTMAYDGHNDNAVAMGTDGYYADLDGVWTDATADNSANTENDYHLLGNNVPGDGRFDQDRIPDKTVELEYGRVDFHDLSWFHPISEVELLRNYLNKEHDYRQGMRQLPMRGQYVDFLEMRLGNPVAVSGIRAIGSVCGYDNMEMVWGLPNPAGQKMYTPFSFAGIDNCVFTSHEFRNDIPVDFYMAFGSGFLNWDTPHNWLRSSIAGKHYGVAAMSGGWPYAYVHPLALGGSFGESARLTQNNDQSEYTVWSYWGKTGPFYAHARHFGLMGDPTLRLFNVVPPAAVSIAQNAGSHPALSWAASPQASEGYLVYRSANPNGPFARVTPSMISGTSWSDASVSSGTWCYQVKAVMLQATAGGTFLNASQAITTSITLGGAQQNIPPVVDAGADQATMAPATTVTVSGAASDSDGSIVTIAWSQLSGAPAAIQSPGSPVTTIAGLGVGTSVFRLIATDNLGAMAWDDVQVTVSAAANAAPIAQAGMDLAIVLPSAASLAGAGSDDGLPNPPGALSHAWTQLGGPGSVAFADAGAAHTTATFPSAGTYTLRLSVGDGALSGSDDLVITVAPAPAPAPTIGDALGF
ncbi:MAG: hypothetical protein H0W72_09815, partial [Planctomycetes bacterium]|nr:hypothetical protein [Planctomycetota bacterium]